MLAYRMKKDDYSQRTSCPCQLDVSHNLLIVYWTSIIIFVSDSSRGGLDQVAASHVQ